MKIKTVTVDGKTYAELDSEGRPVYVHDDGKEIGFDAPASVDKIKALNAEAKGHREAKEAAEGKLKGFEGIEDAEAARKALETVANLDQGKLVEAGKVQEIKDAARRAAEEQVTEVKKNLEAQIAQLTQTNQQLESGWNGERLGTSFANSKFVSEKLAVPGAVAQKIFGDSFKIEDGKIVGYKDGTKIYSRENPGDAAGFDEALGVLVDSYAFRESIVRGSGGGSGGRGGAGGGGNGLGAKEITRAEFDRLQPADRSVKMSEGFVVVDAPAP